MSDEIELRHLRYFLAVADTLHFSKAAARLGIAQPPLSQQIKRLETLIGHKLFERTTRGVRLTLAGQLLAQRARHTLEKMQDDIAQVRRLGRGEEGNFRKRYPHVELRLRELVTAAQIDALLNGSIDLGFLRDGDPTPGLAMTTLVREQYVAVISASHPLAAKRVIRVQALAPEPFILYSRRMGPLAFDRTMECCERVGFRPNITQDAPQWSTVLRLIAAGVGVSLAPACVANISLPGVVFRTIRSTCRTSIDLAYKAGTPGRLAANFIAIARGQLADGEGVRGSLTPRP
jgi:DNA-binding transcriptional LysR family regulator